MAAGIARWPAPYLQPDRHRDCSFYAAAYVARCLGHPQVTAATVKAWRAQAGYGEVHYADLALGAEMRHFWDAGREGGEEARRPFWLGPRYRPWVRRHLEGGWIAQVLLNRVPGMGHAAVMLECAAGGVLLMDPVYGHVTEPWEWLLGPGGRTGHGDWPGSAPDGRPFYGCHFVEGWYRLPAGPGAPP